MWGKKVMLQFDFHIFLNFTLKKTNQSIILPDLTSLIQLVCTQGNLVILSKRVVYRINLLA